MPLWMLAALPAIAVAAVARQARPLPPALHGVRRIVCLGDSITEGGENPGGYVWLIRRYLQALYPSDGIEVINAGISGHKSNDMLARFDRDVVSRKPDLVTISVGINDVWHGVNGVPLPAFRTNVTEMVRKAQAAGIRVVVLSTTVIYEDAASPENAKLVAYNRALRTIASAHGCLYIDQQKPFWKVIRAYRDSTGAADNLLTVDGVHMNASGNRVMAQTILSGLGIAAADRAAVEAQAEGR